MRNISRDLAKLIFDDLPKPLNEWWQPVPGTDEETQQRLHRARIIFTRAVIKLHHKSGCGLYSRACPAASALAQVRLVREQIAQARLQEVEHIKIKLPADPIAASALRQEIFPYLPSDLSRYMYLTLLRDVERPRFNYPALRDHFSSTRLHIAIVNLASRLVWKICLTDEANLLQLIGGCVKEMSGGSVDDFMQWCSDSVVADAPFLDLDQVLRRCLIPIANRIDFPILR